MIARSIAGTLSCQVDFPPGVRAAKSVVAPSDGLPPSFVKSSRKAIQIQKYSLQGCVVANKKYQKLRARSIPGRRDHLSRSLRHSCAFIPRNCRSLHGKESANRMDSASTSSSSSSSSSIHSIYSSSLSERNGSDARWSNRDEASDVVDCFARFREEDCSPSSHLIEDGAGDLRFGRDWPTMQRDDARIGHDWPAVQRSIIGVVAGVLVAGGCFLFAPRTAFALGRGRGAAHRDTSNVVETVRDKEKDGKIGNAGAQFVRSKKVELAKTLDLGDLGEKAIMSHLKRNPTDQEGWKGLLKARLEQGDMQGIIEPLQHLVALNPSETAMKLLLGQAQVNVRDLHGARKTYESVLEREPYQPIALQGVAALMAEVGEGSLVLDMLEKVVQQAEENSMSKDVLNLKMLLGQVHTVQGNMEAAMQCYDEIIQADSKDFRPHLSKGLILSIMGQVREADREFKRFRELCPKEFPHRDVMFELIRRAKTESRNLGKSAKSASEAEARTEAAVAAKPSSK